MVKYYWIIILASMSLSTRAQQTAKTENIILVTWDGYRWQEMFGGPQKKIVADKQASPHGDSIIAKYGDPDPTVSRAKLMPFIWNVIGKQGQIYGNKKLHNRATITNIYQFSYPGYNEIFTGWADLKIHSNDYPDDPNYNIFDFLASKKEFENKIAAFGTWDAFTRIVNTHRNHVPVFVDNKADSMGGFHKAGLTIDKWQTSIPAHNPSAATDTFTYKLAKEYLQRYHPRFTFIGFDETDHYSHEGDYLAYLNSANTLDKYLADLWDFVQHDPQYKDKTTIIVTCDHGRGHIARSNWRHHGVLTLGANNIWMAAIGPDIKPKGEMKSRSHIRQNQFAATIAALLGYEYANPHRHGKAIKQLTMGK